MASTELVDFLIAVRKYEVHHPRAVFLKSQRLEQQEVSVGRDVLLHVDESVRYAVGSEHVRVRLFANLTLKLFPSVRNEVGLLLLGHLLLEPVLEAFVVNESHGAIALARIQQWVLRRRVVVPANLTVDVGIGCWVHHPAINVDCFLLKLLMK